MAYLKVSLKIIGTVPEPAHSPGLGSFLDLGHLRAGQPSPKLDLRLDLGAGLVLHLLRG